MAVDIVRTVFVIVIYLLNANIDAKKKAQYQTSLTQNYYNRIITYVLIMHNEYPEAVVIDPD